MEMPTRNGISIPTYELALPESILDLNRPENFNNHHTEWSRRSMGRFAITQTLRDLERLQHNMPRDVHQELHKLYSPPRFPSPKEAMDEVMLAYDNKESMKIWIQGLGYVLHPITDIHMKTLQAEYNQHGNL